MPLEKARHVRYWQRCRSTLLPAHYTPHDSTRMTLAFFIVSALDLLSTPSEPLLSPDDKRDIRSWVLSLQHPAGGFVGSPTHLLPRENYLAGDGAGGDANLAATYFALLLLAIADEGGEEGCAFAGVDRAQTLAWLKRLQRADGSFGEVVDGEGRVSGGRDMRYCYLAACVRWCLRGDVEEGSEAWVEDIDVAGLVAHIRRAQTYDGGMGESSQHESHAGYAYCAIAALSLLERPLAESATPPPRVMDSGIPDVPALVKFLVGRQLAYVDPPEGDDDDDDDEEDPDAANCLEVGLGKLGLGEFVGFNGRWNKEADTCYCWWVGATLKILGHDNLISNGPSRAFLLDKTQHIVGGFGKHPGSSPDAYHAYLGLAALATLGDEELGGFDAGLCVSEGVVPRIERGRAVLVRGGGGE
ncbi:related to geranylgeranyltransferase beta subunit [Cephalotrichum gorgonifer]|uniref:Geranylgeranyl transferase type-1 subunit beta n=1 Tax=Cephalotrichum gorgonifer TaxID=2041049 RepID=A0AAE8MN63_9PEZI|nr:related to geranylgeranyltransferase beta subunit [Cephalotrichum gorgonifer]